MECALTEGRREDLWEALSDAFIDNHVNFEFIARRVEGVPIATVKEVFFSDVAPQCAFNVFDAIPPVWDGFDREGLAECIRAMHEHNRRSFFARWKHRASVACYRVVFRPCWQRIEQELRLKERRCPPTESPSISAAVRPPR